MPKDNLLTTSSDYMHENTYVTHSSPSTKSYYITLVCFQFTLIKSVIFTCNFGRATTFQYFRFVTV